MIKQTTIQLHELHSQLLKLDDRTKEIRAEQAQNKFLYEHGKIDEILLKLRDRALEYELCTIERKFHKLDNQVEFIAALIEAGLDLTTLEF